MSVHRALAGSVLALALVAPAAAQFPPPPGQSPSQASPFPPPPGQGGNQASPFPPAGQAPRQASPFPPPGGGFPAAGRNVCDTFPAIRDDAEKRANAIRAAGERKAAREEVCPLFKSFVAAEAKMVKFLEVHQAACNVPPDAVKQVKVNHSRTVQMSKQVCSAGGGGGGPRPPSLSDAFSGPAIPSEPPKPGRGTFDTLTGSPLGR